ncbi:MAG: phosphoglucosamine mutase [Opitutales bacterium]
MKQQLFGTDGVRGPYGTAQMNEPLAWRLGAGAAAWVKQRPDIRSARVIIGRDTRASGPALEAALAAGLTAGGLQPVSLGVVPSPAVSLLTRHEQAALGAVITASHNPAGDNGIKFFGPAGLKLPDAEEAKIAGLMPAQPRPPLALTPPSQEGLALYTDTALSLLPAGSLRGWKIAVDAANGAACRSTPDVLRRLGAELSLLGVAPDGTNINAGVGSQHPEALSAAVRSQGGRLGIAHDGDADRCVLCDETGGVLDGDELLTILALHALAQGRLVKNTLVITVQSNLGVDAAVQAAGGRVCRSAVGDRYVIERMLAEGATLGGESSGHVICSEISSTGDGLVAALKVIGVMLATGQPLSRLRRQLRKFPQLTAALTVREKKPLENLAALSAAIAAAQADLGTQGRVLVRYSGTETKLRLLVEGPADDTVRTHLTRLIAATRADLDVLAV